MSAFIGRDGELKILDAALGQASRGAGNYVILRGEAGIGKSHLIREARRRAAQRGFLVLSVACVMQDQAAALAPLRPLLKTCAQALIAQEKPSGDEGARSGMLEAHLAGRHRAGAPRALFETLTTWLDQRAAVQPVLLAFEDLHWSDDATRAFLVHLIERLPGKAMFLLLSYRTPVPDPLLGEALQALQAYGHARAVALNPLSRSEVAQVMRQKTAGGWPNRFYYLQRVYEVSRGNPLFVEEICLSSTATESVSPETDLLGLYPLPQAAVPRSVRRIIRQRVWQVSRAAQRVADVAAVHGRAFDLRLLEAVTGLSESVLRVVYEELVGARLAMRTGTGTFVFRHAMVREALCDRLLIRERRALHGALLQAMETVYGGALEERLGDLTYHAYEAGCWDRVVRYARRAGEQALALGAPVAATAQYTRAIEAAERIYEVPSWELLCGRAHALQVRGDIDGALTDYAAALDSARVMGDREAERLVVQKLAGLLPSLAQAHASDYYGQIVGDAGGIEVTLAAESAGDAEVKAG